MWHWVDGWSWTMGVGMVIVWAAVIVGGVWLVARLLGPTGNARRILEERLARGEIDPEEFEGRARLLQGR